VTYSTIQKIFRHHRVFTPLLSLLLAFGSKTKEDENIRDEYYFQVADHTKGSAVSYGKLPQPIFKYQVFTSRQSYAIIAAM
jgi:hypothetical protein